MFSVGTVECFRKATCGRCWVHVAEMLVFSEAASVIHWLVFLSIAALEQVRKALFHLWPHEGSSLTPFARVCLISPRVHSQVTSCLVYGVTGQ